MAVVSARAHHHHAHSEGNERGVEPTLPTLAIPGGQLPPTAETAELPFLVSRVALVAHRREAGEPSQQRDARQRRNGGC